MRDSAKDEWEAPSFVWSFQAQELVSHNTFVWSLDGASLVCDLMFQTYTNSSSFLQQKLKIESAVNTEVHDNLEERRSVMILIYKNLLYLFQKQI